MKKIALLAFMLLANQASAASMTANGSGALALTALVAPHGRTLGVVDRIALSRLFSGRTNFGYPANRRIMVSADAIDCRSSNVDITENTCELTLTASKRMIKGREAHELFATLLVAGVPSDGAAGAIHESVSHLLCTIDPSAIKQKDY